MDKITEILIGTNNVGKYKEICDLLPKKVKKYSLGEFKISSPEETGKSFKENALIKASYFSKKTNLICLSDDSGLKIDLLNGLPGIYSARWGGKKGDFNLAISKVFQNAGICAAPVMSPALLMNDPHMLDRGNFITVAHDIAGEHLVSRPSWRAKRRTELPSNSGPCFGADSDEVLSELGYSEKDIEGLYDKGVTSRSLLGGR